MLSNCEPVTPVEQEPQALPVEEDGGVVDSGDNKDNGDGSQDNAKEPNGDTEGSLAGPPPLISIFV
jgi:hypothetical protein